jgi:urease alpha subunit
VTRRDGPTDEPGERVDPLVPGEVRLGAGTGADAGGPRRPRVRLVVTNRSRRAVRVSSHYPFELTNPRLSFDRGAAIGHRLDLPAGASLRWGPGETREVDLVPYAGSTTPGSAEADRGDASGSLESRAPSARPTRPIPAEERLARYGPTRDDRIRLGDSDLWIRVADDRTAIGDEPIWGYGKDLRSRMTQGDRRTLPSELDILVAGAVVLDPVVGAVKADIGIKDGRIVGIGAAGNPAISDGIDLVIGPHTEPIMAYGLIATPGVVDSHVHLTTLITAGFEEPPWAMERTLLAVDDWPVNLGLQAGARDEDPAGLEALLAAGAIGLKIHEDYGAYPELIDAVLGFADLHDVAVALHTDGLHESAELEDTVAAVAGRTVHAYHVEGTGGGHLPDLIGLVREGSIICSSTTPTVPYGRAAPIEHIAMTLLNHGGGWGVPGDLDLVRERIHPATMAAEGPLHELGAIAIVNSDSQGMGRIGETLRRTLQLAHVMKRWRRGLGAPGGLPPTLPGLPPDTDDPTDDTARVLRYLAKCTIEPAVVHGVADHVGSLQVGRLADIVLWRPADFGVKPALVLKGGHQAWGALGDGNASLERSEPTVYGPHWGGLAGAAPVNAVTFATEAALAAGLPRRLGSRRSWQPVRGCRGLTRASLVWNRSVAAVEVDPGDGAVTLDGGPVAVEPVRDVPLSRRYLLR